jgi:curved DNA-binding protein CbpA
MTAREILGVELNATDEQIRAAYLAKITEHPPDRSPTEFERIRDAYDTLRDPRRRMNEILHSRDSLPSISSIFAGLEPERQYVGPGPWLEVLKGK